MIDFQDSALCLCRLGLQGWRLGAGSGKLHQKMPRLCAYDLNNLAFHPIAILKISHSY